MKKKVKVSVIVASSIVVVIVAAALIMSFVKVTPTKYFSGYDRVAVVTSSQFEMAETEDSQKAIKNGLKKTEFSVMHAVLEGTFSYSPKLVKEDGDTVYLSVQELKNLAPKANTKMLKFYYSTPKTIKVDGLKIIYDRLIVEFAYGDGEIINATCTPYLESNIDNNSFQDEVGENGFIGSVYYEIPQFTVRMYASALYDAISELK